MLGLAFALTFAPAALGSSGGVTYAPEPSVGGVACVGNCAPNKRIQGGSTAKISGQNLDGVTKVVFDGAGTKGAARAAAVRSHSATAVIVSVPIDAQTGPIQAMASGGVQSHPSKPVKVLPAPPPQSQPQLSPAPGAPDLETAVSTSRWYLGSQRPVLFSYRYHGSAPADVDVSLVRESDGTVVQTWTQPQVPPNDVRSVRWTGVVNGTTQPEGRYAFRAVVHSGETTVSSASAGAADRDAFDLYDHIFPLRARHSYGDGFGAARSGHTHQGQDVMAACGSKLVAAQGGTIVYSGFQSAAGNYVVVHGVDGSDNAYMHLAQPSPFSEGDPVFTGEQIGIVGETGDATACHLHFEIWTSPGWYNGGHAIDPLASLQSWDAFS